MGAIKMEVSFDEAALKKQNIGKEEAIAKFEEVASWAGITKKEGEGVYIGNGDKYDFANFGKIAITLSEENWFLSIVDKWDWFVNDTYDDLAAAYKYKAKAV